MLCCAHLRAVFAVLQCTRTLSSQLLAVTRTCVVTVLLLLLLLLLCVEAALRCHVSVELFCVHSIVFLQTHAPLYKQQPEAAFV
jgi:hypothetical protein